jgi:DNA-binding transcriptional ArsR family regulator
MPFDNGADAGDLGVLRAVSHPVRLALLEALRRESPLTATRAAELVSESPSNCSFHLRVLARHGFVEEAGGGHGRRRPWRRTQRGLEITPRRLTGAARAGAIELMSLFLERGSVQLKEWFATAAGYPDKWVDAAVHIGVTARLTADELEAVKGELEESIGKAIAGTAERDERHDAVPVTFLVHAFPLVPPAEDGV